jgi:hypothetical protein
MEMPYMTLSLAITLLFGCRETSNPSKRLPRCQRATTGTVALQNQLLLGHSLQRCGIERGGMKPHFLDAALEPINPVLPHT